LLFATTARAELLAEFGWDNPRPVDPATATYHMGPWFVFNDFPGTPAIPKSPCADSTNPGDCNLVGSGNATYADPLIEEWWTDDIGQHGAIQFGVTDSVGTQQVGGRYGLSLDWFLQLDGYHDIVTYPYGTIEVHDVYYGQAHAPLTDKFQGYDIESIDRVVTPTTMRYLVHGRPLTLTDADANSDGVVDAADYVVLPQARYTWWRAHFGMTVPQPGLSASAVPEPNALWLAAFLVICLTVDLSRRRRKIKCVAMF
jgi:hypothetical protein